MRFWGVFLALWLSLGALSPVAAQAPAETTLSRVTAALAGGHYQDVVTLAGLDFGSYLSGSVLTESIFAWPGVGQYAMQAILRRDFPAIQGTVLFAAFFVVIANLVVDIVYAFLDPRVRYS